jgi:fucose permease
MGVISDRTHKMAIAMIVVLLCYMVVTWYAFLGSKQVKTDTGY